jgi:hypothetical protein
MPLVYVPAERAFFLWDEGAVPRAVAAAARVRIAGPSGTKTVDGSSFALLDTVAALALVRADEVASLEPSVACWALASKLALDLVARERIVPALAGGEARWAVATGAADDAQKLAAIAKAMPIAGHAVPVSPRATREVWAPDALLRRFLDDTADAFARKAASERGLVPAASGWERRLARALASADARFEASGFLERTLADDLRRWSAPAIGARDALSICFRLELPPKNGGDRFALRLFLQPADDPSLFVPASDVWRGTKKLAKLGHAFRDAEGVLLEGLARAARIYEPVGASLRDSEPAELALDAASAWRFLSEGAQVLASAGFRVMVPGELTAQGQRRLRLRMRVGARTGAAGAVEGASRLGLPEIVEFEWEAAVGDRTLSARELAALAEHKAPLVRHRGQWIAIDPSEIGAIRARMIEPPGTLSAREALAGALAGEIDHRGMRVGVAASPALTSWISELRASAAKPIDAPRSFVGTLRPYQARGLAWLRTLASLGLGACLADDMGLGKTIQYLAFLLARLESDPSDPRPSLLVAPTSVIGNWEREVARFAPDLRVLRHYGTTRSKTTFESAPDTLVITTYGLLRRDAELLASTEWASIALDEAQNIKNAASATARAARRLRAAHRFALTGTPVENRLAELWSILEFANPGLLGSLERFKRDFAVPIERYGSDAAAHKLKRIVGPFVLRRLKSDPAIIDDLPPKNEMKVICSLTKEQASLYRAAVDEEMRRIESAEGIERRGRVLALLGFLKQICNHPAQYLGEKGPLLHRSGKLTRASEMLEEALSAGDKALVFTQFRQMGELLRAHFAATLDAEIAFLHGGTPQRARDEMVRRFQEEPSGPRVFVLSVKAGGTGLNLTAASHVFHFDRWWNPAVEDQATDRAYRIGQTRPVQVHKLLCAGTIEEKVDRMLEDKRALADKVVGTGERWITELDDAGLRDLVALSSEIVVDEVDAPARLVEAHP